MTRDPVLDELELAVARLEWAKAAHCLDIPAQATAVRWHEAACDEARDVVAAEGGAPE
jgi:hypothetical protein